MKSYLLILITSLFLVAGNNAADTKFTTTDSPVNPDYTYLKNMPACIAAIANFNAIPNKPVNKAVPRDTMKFEMGKLAKYVKAKILL